MGKIFKTNSPKEQAEVAIQILRKNDFQSKVIKKDEEGKHFIHIKGKIYQDKLSIVNMFQKQDTHMCKRNFTIDQGTH